MSNEFTKLKDDMVDGVKKFSEAPSIQTAFKAASSALWVAGGALAIGLLWKPALLVAFGAAAYGAYKAYNTYTAGGGSGPAGGATGSKPDDLTI